MLLSFGPQLGPSTCFIIYFKRMDSHSFFQMDLGKAIKTDLSETWTVERSAATAKLCVAFSQLWAAGVKFTHRPQKLRDGQTTNLKPFISICPSLKQGQLSPLKNKSLSNNFYMQPAPSNEPKEHEPFPPLCPLVLIFPPQSLR